MKSFSSLKRQFPQIEKIQIGSSFNGTYYPKSLKITLKPSADTKIDGRYINLWKASNGLYTAERYVTAHDDVTEDTDNHKTVSEALSAAIHWTLNAKQVTPPISE